MGRNRYAVSIGEEIPLGCKIYEPTHPHFITCTVLNWIPIFTNQESVDIIIDSLKYLQKSDNLTIHAYVILENHLHLIAKSNDITQSMARFKAHTARTFIKLLTEKNVTTILEQLR